jgi:hypothetical protein
MKALYRSVDLSRAAITSTDGSRSGGVANLTLTEIDSMWQNGEVNRAEAQSMALEVAKGMGMPQDVVRAIFAK